MKPYFREFAIHLINFNEKELLCWTEKNPLCAQAGPCAPQVLCGLWLWLVRPACAPQAPCWLVRNGFPDFFLILFWLVRRLVRHGRWLVAGRLVVHKPLRKLIARRNGLCGLWCVVGLLREWLRLA